MNLLFSQRLFGAAAGLLLLALLTSSGVRADLGLQLQRQSFRAAEQALQRGDLTSYRTLLPTVDGYPLLPYLQYQELQARLETLPTSQVRAFLSRYPDTPLHDRLHRAWIRTLAEQKQWSTLLNDYQPGENAELDCLRRQALLATGDSTAALAAIDEVWLQGVSLPAACDPLFSRWREQGGFTPTRIWRRFGLAMEQRSLGLARYLQGLLPTDQQPVANAWLAVDAAPRRVLNPTTIPTHSQRQAILIHGLARLTHIDSLEAAGALDILRQRYPLDDDALGPVARRIALYLAARDHPSALARLTTLPDSAVDDDVAEWRVRVPLKREDWPTVLRWLEAMPAELAAEPTWRYWQARGLAATGEQEAAKVLFEAVAEERDYYGFLAADWVGRPYQFHDRPVEADQATNERVANLPAIRRAREFYILGREGDAYREWATVLEDAVDPILIAAARLAHDWGWHHQAIITLAKAERWDDLALRFPLPHRQRVMAEATRRDLDPAWIYAVMRQESLFRATVRSPAGALGLMQIMPGTGRLIAGELGTSLASTQALLDPDRNIIFGSYYLRRNRNRLQNHIALATAAYNAGGGRVQQWLPEAPLAADIWAETIPFKETRGYVKRVLEYAVVYRERLALQPQPLSRHLGHVLPAVES